jgi:RNA polymerase sigma-70 factor (ECF subfamily)
MAECLVPARVAAPEEAEADAETVRLVQLALGGDGDAFGMLVSRHARAAQRVARAALVQPQEAEDAVQEACLTAWMRLGDLDRPERFRAWLLSITWRKALDRRRSLTTWWHRLVQPAVSDGGDPLEQAVSIGPSPLDEAAQGERDRAIARAVRSLPAHLRDALLLVTAGDHRYEEIAAILRVPVGTVKWRVSRARQVVKDKLARLGYRG